MEKITQRLSDQAISRSSNGTPAQFSKRSLPITKQLMLLGSELVTSGRMKEPASDDLLRILIDDLSEYPETWVIRAIHEHRKASPFWPALADLVKHMQPSIDAEKQRRAFKRRQEESRAFVQGTGHKSKLSEEERKAFVIAELGYNPNGLHRMSKKAWADECDAQGLTLEQVETMPAEDVCKAFMKHDKPWHDPKHLKASARRLAVYMDKQDPDWRNAS